MAETTERGPFRAIEQLAEAIARGVQADAAVVRFPDHGGDVLVARVVWTDSPARSAELVGSRLSRAPGGNGSGDVIRRPVLRGGRIVAELELQRTGRPFDEREISVAEMGALQLGHALRAVELGRGASEARTAGRRTLELVGDALVAGSEGGAAAGQIVRLAADAAGASAALLWRTGEDGVPVLAAAVGAAEPVPAALVQAVERTLGDRRPALSGPARPNELVATIKLGEPPLGALQLLFDEDAPPAEDELAALTTFAVRAAHTLRSSEALVETKGELERTRALVTVISQAIAQLSLAHTLETALDRVAELLEADRLAVYLRDEGGLQPVAARGLVGPHLHVAERLLALGLGRFRGRETVHVAEAPSSPLLEEVRGAVAESAIEAVLAVPLVAHEEVIGLLAVYLPAARRIEENEAALVGALAAQLAVVVENARLHERAKELGSELEQVLDSERQVARHLRALYEVSRSFAQSMSLETTLAAVTEAVVETLGIGAAAIRMLDERGSSLETRSVYVAAEELEEAVAAILGVPQPATLLPVRRLLRSGAPLRVDADEAALLPAHQVLIPFLEKGASCVIVPVATPAEVLGTLTLLSLDPARPLTEGTVEVASSIAGQAALAIDNARLYQQQKSFADTMQRSLLPRTEPRIPGLDVGVVYESSARVDVGGDLYDFLTLSDGRLAVVLGDVTGHGVDAAADMAMAKFVFRSLAREHPEPADFLAAANEVVGGEIAIGKFITLVYVVADPEAGMVACASAGHPAPRVVGLDGSVRALETTGLPLGVEPAQVYEEVRESLEPGGTLVLYTDGVVEARRGKELYGTERLDALLAGRRTLRARKLAREILEDCRAFGGDPSDDCAIVVIKRK
jgi:serine phosphatase RsbU (regulator of sigma subunit)